MLYWSDYPFVTFFACSACSARHSQRCGLACKQNFGLTWAIQSSAPSGVSWFCVASSSTGQMVAGVVVGGGVYTSQVNLVCLSRSHIASRVANFCSRRLPGVPPSNLCLCFFAKHAAIFSAKNNGSTFSLSSSAPLASWYGIASNSNGQYLVAIVTGGGIWASQVCPDSSCPLVPLLNPLLFALVTILWCC